MSLLVKNRTSLRIAEPIARRRVNLPTLVHESRTENGVVFDLPVGAANMKHRG
jgi:hypothetical protein